MIGRVLGTVLVICAPSLGHAQLQLSDYGTLDVTTPHAVIAEDFNGDGVQDLGVASTGSSEVKIALGHSDGGFGPFVGYATGTPYHLSCGDFNGDEVIDIAAANLAHGTFSILLGEGDGTFSPLPPQPCGALPTCVNAADFDEDDDLDLVLTCHGSETIEVYFNNGAGIFSSSLALTYVDNPTFVVADDFTGNGHVDLVVSNSIDSNFGIFEGNGLGQFPNLVPFDLGVDDSVWSITKHDINGDSYLDLVAPCPNQNLVVLLLGVAGGGFTPTVTYLTGEQPHAVLLTDLNLDLCQDL